MSAPAAAGGTTNVAVFTDNDFEKVNGVTTTLKALLRWCPPDIRARIYTADAHGTDDSSYLALRSLGVGIPFYREMKMYVPRLAAYVNHARADRVGLLHLTTPGPIGLAALFVAHRLRLPMVGSFHTDLASYTSLLSGSPRLGRLMNEYLRWPYGRCARVFVPSVATATALDAARVARGKHVLWVRGVDTVAFSPDRRSAALRESWTAPADTPVVIYLGRLSREKGVLDFVAVAERLRSQRRAHKLVFVGDGPLRAELASRLPDAVCTGAVPHHAVGTYLASADVFAFPSRTDTAGNVVLEAQACGLPAVVRAEGGPRENVVPGQTAVIAAATDEFVVAIDGLLGNPVRRAGMGNAARGYALTRDWPTALAPLFSAYRQLAVPVEDHLSHAPMAIVAGRRC